MYGADLFIALDLGNVLSLVDEGVGAREFANMSGKQEWEAFDAVFAPARKVPIETGNQSIEDFSRECCERLGVQIPQDRFRTVYESVLTPNWAVFPLVERLMRSYRMGLCSNTSSVHWELERRRLPFARRLEPAIVSYQVGVMKPEPGIFAALARQAGVDAGRILFIDDRSENVEGAERAGLSALEFKSVAGLEADLKRLGVI
ncbi:MAG: HAD family phosphatase [Dehalococcoidia bacterium]|nr:HAD family phosphatase [Dehalococcoidia bacterium]MSQ34462.1 HAD family phosphatase [Dehalococcoidia bacterium]